MWLFGTEDDTAGNRNLLKFPIRLVCLYTVTKFGVGSGAVGGETEAKAVYDIKLIGQ